MISPEAALTWFDTASIFKYDSWEEHGCVNENASLINPNANILEQSRQKLQKLGKYKIGRNPSPKKGEIYLRSLWLSLLSSLLGSPPRSSLLGSSFTLASDDDRVSLEITVENGILDSFWSYFWPHDVFIAGKFSSYRLEKVTSVLIVEKISPIHLSLSRSPSLLSRSRYLSS